MRVHLYTLRIIRLPFDVGIDVASISCNRRLKGAIESGILSGRLSGASNDILIRAGLLAGSAYSNYVTFTAADSQFDGTVIRLSINEFGTVSGLIRYQDRSRSGSTVAYHTVCVKLLKTIIELFSSIVNRIQISLLK